MTFSQVFRHFFGKCYAIMIMIVIIIKNVKNINMSILFSVLSDLIKRNEQKPSRHVVSLDSFIAEITNSC